ncbi:hypothetical protein PAEPH01_1599 [Pancytospora epiphaga]|nr:hypothetical protein PAEPH01_1599 [Pancytospora epiphaga]
MHKYDVLANKLGQEYGCRTRIIPYVMTWDEVVTKYYRRHLKNIGITGSYIQTTDDYIEDAGNQEHVGVAQACPVQTD